MKNLIIPVTTEAAMGEPDGVFDNTFETRLEDLEGDGLVAHGNEEVVTLTFDTHMSYLILNRETVAAILQAMQTCETLTYTQELDS